MSKNKTFTAIELGTSKIVTLVAQKQEDMGSGEETLNVLGVSSSESRGIRKGQVVDLDEAVQSLVVSVEAAERMAGFNINNCLLAIGGAHISSVNSKGVVAVSNPQGEISYEDVDRVIQSASAVSLPSSREIVHVIPREYFVDGDQGIKDPVGMTGVRLEVDTHIITSSQAAIKNLQKTLNEVGVNVNDMVFSGLASAEAVLTKTEKELGCVVVDLGGGTASIVAYFEGSPIYSGVLPIGAKNITNDLAIGLRISLESAEKVKLHFSDEANKVKKDKVSDDDHLDLSNLGIPEIKKVSRKTIVEGIIRPRLNEIFTVIKMNLEKEKLLNMVPAGIVITGGGANTVGLLESVKRIMPLPARLGIPRGITGLIDDIINPAYATSIGLLLYAGKPEQNEHLTSGNKKIKLPNISVKGIPGKLISALKDLLP